MPQRHLRVYHGPHTDTRSAVADSDIKAGTVTVPLSDVMHLLADAVASRRTWLSDFQEDEITISGDLYEVLLAYQHFRRPSA